MSLGVDAGRCRRLRRVADLLRQMNSETFRTAPEVSKRARIYIVCVALSPERAPAR